ncbi:TRAP-type C4-dicarboxylate transport system [Halalkalibacter wakoensis JCM 9140]|uniref:TRAP-type C4-dicarboxylate transport system n=1 Tax=Halalkalibacter wakoensis JCM 9140 TaxID=1236970 RepID=W4Q8T3_9BACI|nr:TRAP transporter large permease [Halalkalibacter wakoensis]GAE28093.1 TRAP-type C4-dicarboxylate transport system [Halalkalibacter wakoensis JCM 9140]
MIWFFVLLMVLVFSGMPMFIAIAGSVLFTLVGFTDIPAGTVIQRMFAGLDKFPLMAIPLFVLAANIMSAGGISKRVIALTNSMVGRIPGGMAISVVLSCLFFGAISGSSPATVVAIGSMMLPAMMKANYPRTFATGLIGSTASLGIIIPPSITMIVYGAVTGASVGELFIAGLGAGIAFAIIFIIYCLIYGKKHNLVSKEPWSFREVLFRTKDAVFGLGIPVIIIGGIYGGLFTPTESAGVAVIYAFIVSMFVYREITWKQMYNVLVDSAKMTATVMIILAAASVLSWYLTVEQITVQITQSITGMTDSRIVILLLMNVIILIAGMFLDGASLIVILAPLFYTIGLQYGIDPIHLGVIMTVNSAIGMFTPPFGLNLFVLMGIAKDNLLSLSKGMLPFVLISLIVLAIITYIPQISMFLPELIYRS